MYSLSTLAYLNNKETAKSKGVKPKVIREVKDAFKVRNSSGKIANVAGFKELETLFVDSSGFGADNELALSVPRFRAKIESLLAEYGTVYGLIVSEGQFQIYMSIYIKE